MRSACPTLLRRCASIVANSVSSGLSLGLGKLDDSALLFPRLNGEPQSPRGFSKEWADVAASIGLLVTFHALRHTHASHLIDAGIDAVKISRRLGHASVDIE